MPKEMTMETQFMQDLVKRARELEADCRYLGMDTAAYLLRVAIEELKDRAAAAARRERDEVL